MAITELPKPVYQSCDHQCDTGCAIHKSKPASCAGFQCFYTQGVIKGEIGRPDNLGIMLYPAVSELLGDVLMAYEVWPGAFKEEKPKGLLDTLKLARVIMLFRHGGGKRSVIGPPSKMPAVVKALAGAAAAQINLPKEITNIDLPNTADDDAATEGSK